MILRTGPTVDAKARSTALGSCLKGQDGRGGEERGEWGKKRKGGEGGRKGDERGRGERKGEERGKKREEREGVYNSMYAESSNPLPFWHHWDLRLRLAN